MSLLEIVIYAVIAGLCGGMARAVAGGSLLGLSFAVVVGFFGALVGAWVAYTLGLPELLEVDIAGHRFPIVWSVMGAFALVVLAHVLMWPSGMSRQLRRQASRRP